MAHDHLDLNLPQADETRTTTCYMCACRCGIHVHLKNGRIRYIQGNRDHPVNRGVICAKGSAGSQQHYSPARLRTPLKRVGARGAGEFEEISWDEALALATSWLAPLRASNPDGLAFFTGRDQSQALTGWWAQQFGTVNYAAHGGFCSVNMAAAGMYTLGSSFWEFGEPDFEHARYLMLWGVAEDHDSNPLKLGLGKLKASGAKIVAVNPVKTGYAAIADEWIGIRPGSDGLFALALVHELLRADRIDLDYLVRYANAHWLVMRAPGTADDGLFARDGAGAPLCAIRTNAAVKPTLASADAPDIAPLVVGEYALPDGRIAVPVFQLIAERYLDARYSPEAVAARCGIEAATIRRIAAELAHAAFEEKLELPVRWTDTHGREHERMTGRPVAMHAMRGISAHSNGFQTCRALHLLQLLLGAVETPGSFRFQPPLPRAIPPSNRPGRARRDNGALDAAPLGYPQGPEDLLVDAAGAPRRIDKAYSWEYPLAVHGMLHTVIRNAWAGDPYRIDTLMLFMANMGWNSSMNPQDAMRYLTDRDADSGEYRIPRVIYSDAYASEMVAYADLVLPDTTYLERHDCISLLDRPISDADGAADAIRQPVIDPDRDVRGFQSVLLDLGARLRLPGMTNEDGTARYRDYAEYIVRHERAPGVGLLAGWRGVDGESSGVGAPNPAQLERYIANGCFWRGEIPESGRYFKMANHDYLEWSAGMGFIPRPPALGAAAGATVGAAVGAASAATNAPAGESHSRLTPLPQTPPSQPQPRHKAITLQLYSEPLQRFRLAAHGHGQHQPPEKDRVRIAQHFDPLPIWHEALESVALASSVDAYPLHALTQRPMFMYHAWGSQNRWLRQIATRNFLYLHPDTAATHGLADDDWTWLESPQSRIKVQVRLHAGCEANTVWTWNAVGKRRGSWALAKDAPEAGRGFLMNHLIAEGVPGTDYANADPITGQASWYDLRVRLRKAAAEEATVSEPQFAGLPHAELPRT